MGQGRRMPTRRLWRGGGRRQATPGPGVCALQRDQHCRSRRGKKGGSHPVRLRLTRSIAPPMPLTILPGIIQFARSPLGATCGREATWRAREAWGVSVSWSRVAPCMRDPGVRRVPLEERAECAPPHCRAPSPTCSAPRMVMSTWFPRIMANDSEELQQRQRQRQASGARAARPRARARRPARDGFRSLT